MSLSNEKPQSTSGTSTRCCSKCKGPLRSNNRLGICQRNPGCRAVAARLHRKNWKRANPERAKYHDRLDYERHKDSINAKDRAYYYLHRDKMRARNKLWKLANPEAAAATTDRWRRANPEAVAGYTCKYLEKEKIKRKLRGSWGNNNQYLIRETKTEKKLKREMSKC